MDPPQSRCRRPGQRGVSAERALCRRIPALDRGRPAGGRMMKIGLFVTLETEASMDTVAYLRNFREQVRTDRDGVVESLWLPQHFIVGPTMRQFAASPMLGFLAGIAE